MIELTVAQCISEVKFKMCIHDFPSTWEKFPDILMPKQTVHTQAHGGHIRPKYNIVFKIIRALYLSSAISLIVIAVICFVLFSLFFNVVILDFSLFSP